MRTTLVRGATSRIAAVGWTLIAFAAIVIGCKPEAPPVPPKTGPAKTTSTTTDATSKTKAPKAETPEATTPDDANGKSPDMPAEKTPSGESTEDDKTPPSTDGEDTKKPEGTVGVKPKTREPKPAPRGALAYHGPVDSEGNPSLPSYKGEWNQWCGSPIRNSAIIDIPEELIPIDFVPGEFDRKTGAWKKDTSKNIRYVANLGSQTYGNPVVASGKVVVGTNNSYGYVKRYPADVDLGCLVAFDEKTGDFMWQDSSEKLPTGRVHDWPLMGICCSPLVEGDRCWYVSSRGEVKCLDMKGFHDGTDDGDVKAPQGRLFDIMKGEDPATDKVAPIVAELDEGKFAADLGPRLAKVGFAIEGESTVEVKDKGKLWLAKVKHAGVDRELKIVLAGARFQVFKTITTDDKEEADVLWSIDLMKEFGTSQHNMCSCSVTAWGDFLFVNSSNGVHEDHKTIPAPDAPSFLCMDKNTGKVHWTDNSPGRNILHGQWSSPTVAVIDGAPQVMFGGGDAWLYSYELSTEKKPLWKFDANPKTALLELGGRGTRNDIISTPIVYDGLVYFATGQDPEHGEGIGIFWCLDPTKRGDISEELAVKRNAPTEPIEHKRVQAVEEGEGEVAVPNPNTGVVWKLDQQEVPLTEEEKASGQEEFRFRFHRSIGTPAAHQGMVFVCDFSGLFWCIDAKTGKARWNHDMMAASWGSPLILNDKIYVGDEDGDIAILKVAATKELVAEINMGNSVYSSPIFANGTLYIANKDRLFAIEATKSGE